MSSSYEVLFSVGGVSEDSSQALNTVEKYTGSSDWISCTRLPLGRTHGCLVPAGGLLYSLGGLCAHLRLDTVDVLEPGMEVWTSGPLMPSPRSDFGAVFDSVRGCIYCIGGLVLTHDVATVDILDLHQQIWRTGPTLQAPRSFLGAAILNGIIYAVGGAIGRKRLNWVEKFNTNVPKSDWEDTANLQIPRSRPGVAELNGRIYAVGGYNGSDYLDSVECYSPDIEQWTLIERMASPRNSPGIASFHGRLIVAGGYDGERMLASVESYDPDRGKWTTMTSLSAPRCDFCMSVITVGTVTAIGAWL